MTKGTVGRDNESHCSILSTSLPTIVYKTPQCQERINIWGSPISNESSFGLSPVSESSTRAPYPDASPFSISSDMSEETKTFYELADAIDNPSFSDSSELLKTCTLDKSSFVDIISHVISSTFKSDYTLNLATFKVYMCPFQCKIHDRKICPFYHSNKDRRRYPITYKPEQCEYFFDCEDIGVDCPKCSRCEKCHSRHELLYHPLIYKSRFCASYSMSEPCHRQRFCAFAHSRDEICCDLFSAEEEKAPTVDFFMYNFKTLWCPYGIQHDWHDCLYAHTYQDCRRSPHLGYVSEPCQQWKKDLHSAEYQSRCPLGARCPRSHGSKEQLYHPSYYKVMPCTDYKSTGYCPRGKLCAFYHDTSERREGVSTLNQSKLMELPMPVFYNGPLPEQSMRHLHYMFLKPPLFHLDDFEAFGNTSRKSGKKSMAITTAITDAIRDELGHEHQKNSSKQVDFSAISKFYKGEKKLTYQQDVRLLQSPTWNSLPSDSITYKVEQDILQNQVSQDRAAFWRRIEKSIPELRRNDLRRCDVPSDCSLPEMAFLEDELRHNNDYGISSPIDKCIRRKEKIWNPDSSFTRSSLVLPSYEHDKISRKSMVPYYDIAQ